MTLRHTLLLPRPAFLGGLALAALLAGTALAGGVELDHQGNGRCFDLDHTGPGSSVITSRGNGGCLEGALGNSGQIDIFMLGDNVGGRITDLGAEGAVYMGMCPPGMRLEQVFRAPGETGLRIPRCI